MSAEFWLMCGGHGVLFLYSWRRLSRKSKQLAQELEKERLKKEEFRSMYETAMEYYGTVE